MNWEDLAWYLVQRTCVLLFLGALLALALGKEWLAVLLITGMVYAAVLCLSAYVAAQCIYYFGGRF